MPKWVAMGEKNVENFKILLEYSYSKYNTCANQFLAESSSNGDLRPQYRKKMLLVRFLLETTSFDSQRGNSERVRLAVGEPVTRG